QKRLFEEAQEASRAKSEFLNLAAHELRTPLSVVAGYASMLVDGSLGDVPEMWRRPLGILNGKAAELNRLVDELLLAARIETGMGLGLYISRDLVHGLGGSLVLEKSEPGKGSIFALELPALTEVAELAAVSPVEIPRLQPDG